MSSRAKKVEVREPIGVLVEDVHPVDSGSGRERPSYFLEPGLNRLAFKLATGAGKTTVMAMIIAWQTVNAVRRPQSRRFTRGFLLVTPGITIRDRLRVLQPNDPDSYYANRELVPQDMLEDIKRAKIVITNFHALRAHHQRNHRGAPGPEGHQGGARWV